MNPLIEKMSFASVLRVVGAMIVVAAMCAHLLGNWDGWGAWNDVSRYFAMLATAAFLGIAGLATSFVGRENKGARVFLGLSLIAATANFTTLGGLLHEQVQWDGARAAYSMLSDWAFSSGFTLATAIASAVVVLLPMAWFAFKVMSRPEANRLTAVFLSTNLLMLVPLRESIGVGLLIVAAIAVPTLYLHWRVRNERDEYHARTTEGRFATLVLFAPVIVMIARSLWLYQADELLTFVLTSAGFAATRYIARALEQSSPWQFVNGIVSFGFAICTSALAGALMAPYVWPDAIVPLVGLLAGALVFSMAVQHPQARTQFVNAGVLIFAVAAGLNGLLFGSAAASILGALCGFAIVAGGVKKQVRLIKSIGALTLGAAILPRLIDFVGRVDFTNWVTLAVIGTLVIVLGSLLERRRQKEPV